MKNWQKIAVVVGVVIIVGVIVMWGKEHWSDVVNEALCAIQSNIGLTGTHFHIPNADGGTFTCHG